MRAQAAILGLLALAACSQNNDPLIPATFERPGDIAFLCWNTASSTFSPLTTCEPFVGVDDSEFALIGLVTQTASGEVGAVNFRDDRVQDADSRVPGFTFTRVGEFPSGIAVSAVAPDRTYVASFGARRIESYDTRAFVTAMSVAMDPPTSVLPGGPTDLVMGPEAAGAADAIFTVVPEAGAVYAIALNAGDRTLGAMVEYPITVGTLEAPTAGEATTYERFCPDSLPVASPDPAGVRTAILADGSTPEPHQLTVVPGGACADPTTTCDPELLVADRTLPLIHRFAIGAAGALTALEPLHTGVPIRDLAVSPSVPAEFGSSTGPWQKFVYAIDDTDQSVMVLDYDAASPTFGAILPVRGGEEVSDRLRISGPARSLDVLTPGYEGIAYCGATGQVPTGDEAPLRLRGVFLAVGLATGFVDVIDVVDLDATCRGALCGDADTADDQDQFLYLQRHRPRLASFIEEAIGIQGQPSFLVDGVNRPVAEREEGYTDGLLPFTRPTGEAGCLPGQGLFFEDTVCAAADPWALPAETWTAEWEGTLPQTTAVARWDGTESFVFDDRTNFCEQGVLGLANVALSGLTEDDPEFGYGGDTLEILTEPDESLRGNALCDPFFEPESATEERADARLRIIRAEADRLFIDPRALANTAVGLALAEGCFSAQVGLQVRTGDSFRVVGSSTGFLHRVVDQGELCLVDVAGQPIDVDDPATYLSGRAFRGTTDEGGDLVSTRPYVNPYIAFELGVVPVTDEATLRLALAGLPTLFSVRTGSRGSTSPVATVIESVVYSPTDERMYVIDSNSSALVQYELGEFQLDNVFE